MDDQQSGLGTGWGPNLRDWWNQAEWWHNYNLSPQDFQNSSGMNSLPPSDMQMLWQLNGNWYTMPVGDFLGNTSDAPTSDQAPNYAPPSDGGTTQNA